MEPHFVSRTSHWTPSTSGTFKVCFAVGCEGTSGGFGFSGEVASPSALEGWGPRVEHLHHHPPFRAHPFCKAIWLGTSSTQHHEMVNNVGRQDTVERGCRAISLVLNLQLEKSLPPCSTVRNTMSPQRNVAASSPCHRVWSIGAHTLAAG